MSTRIRSGLLLPILLVVGVVAVVGVGPVKDLVSDVFGGVTGYAYYTKPGIAIGEEFLVVIANPASIATEPFAGADTAKEQACGL